VKTTTDHAGANAAILDIKALVASYALHTTTTVAVDAKDLSMLRKMITTVEAIGKDCPASLIADAKSKLTSLEEKFGKATKKRRDSDDSVAKGKKTKKS
jgi:hypothetical protein